MVLLGSGVGYDEEEEEVGGGARRVALLPSVVD